MLKTPYLCSDAIDNNKKLNNIAFKKVIFIV